MSAMSLGRRGMGGLACVLALCSLSGCGDATDATEKVTGKVTYQGQPLSDVNVTFTPENGRPATGTTDREGRFTLSTFKSDDGAVPGTHKVSISPGGEAAPMPGMGEPSATEAPFPERYGNPDQSGLIVEVKKGEPNDFNLELTD